MLYKAFQLKLPAFGVLSHMQKVFISSPGHLHQDHPGVMFFNNTVTLR